MKKRLPFLAFLLFYLAFSFLTFRDYGCTWDEQDTYQGGAELCQYLIHGVPMSYMDPEHSYPYPFFQCFLIGSTGKDYLATPGQYEIRHLLNLLFAAFLFWAVYEMLLAEYADGLWALAGPVFLFLLLPFLGSIPANPKDIPFAVFYFLSLAVLYLYGRRFPEGRFRWVFFGLLAGFATSSRIVGFTLFPIMVFYDAYLYWMKIQSSPIDLWPRAINRDAKTPSKVLDRNKQKSAQIVEIENGSKITFRKWILGKVLGWIGSFAVSQIVCSLLWPFIGQDYFRNLFTVFWLSAHFPPKFSFLFMGGMADSLTYPWYYLPLWIAITTPLFILAYFLASFSLCKKTRTNSLYALMAAVFVLNLGLYFLLHPAIYDGLRHFLFLLPFLSVLASMAFIEFFRKKRWAIKQKVAAGLTAVGILLAVVELVRLHPYEYAYFNELAGGMKGAYGKYETDYWVASMKEAVKWLEANEIKDPGRSFKVYADGKPFQAQIYFLPNMTLVSRKEDADYAIIMTRAGFKPDPGDEDKVIHRVEREGAPLSFILRLK